MATNPPAPTNTPAPTSTPAPGAATGNAEGEGAAPQDAAAQTVVPARANPPRTDGRGRATTRLDAELVRRGLARARGQADELVRAGRVRVDGTVARKVSQPVTGASDLVVEAGETPDYVGRGALKLAGLLDDLGTHGTPPQVHGRRCLDAGASTGGFTQVLLERGASTVVAVDVGHAQLAASLREDERVVDREGTSVRGLRADDVAGQVDLLVADLSFISVTVVLGDLVDLVRRGGDLLILVKPQFEVGRERLGAGGVVRDVPRRVDAVLSVLRGAVQAHGLHVRAVRASRWPGPSGNVEYFVWLTRPGDTEPSPPLVVEDSLERVVRHAVTEGPQ